MASGRVRVSPGMLETKVMMAPNSPRLAAKAVTMPAAMPGSASGRVTLRSRFPPHRAQRLRRRAEAGVDGFERQADGADLEGEGDDRGGERRAGPAEHEADAEIVQQPAAERAARAEGDQQQEADGDRRQHQGHMDQPVDQRLAGELRARQQEGGGEGEGQRRKHRDGGDPQGQKQRLALGRRQGPIHAAMTGKLLNLYIGGRAADQA